MDINNLTQEQRKDMIAQLKEQERAERERVNNERDAYKRLVSEMLCKWFNRLRELSLTITSEKSALFSDFDTVIALKEDLYKTKIDRQSNTFTDDKGITITLGHRVVESYDDTLDAGIRKVRDYLKSLAKNEESAALVEIITKLLTKDRKGNLKANRIVELSQLADRVESNELSEGIKIIQESYHPMRSCRFVEVKAKDGQGKDMFLPLSMSAADVVDEKNV